jgi:hypothetical protein
MNKDTFVLKEAVEFIHKFHMMNKSVNLITPPEFQKKIYLQMDQSSIEDYSQSHRSGWQFVLSGIKGFDAKINGIQGNHLLFDDYVDKSFHWGLVALKQHNVIPYQQPWAGFVHHTFHESNGTNGCYNLFTNACFLESLSHCKCLLTMSAYLKRQLDSELAKIGHEVPVHVIYHPTEFTEKMFTVENFYNNKDRNIVQIGSWLRNPFPFYVIDSPFGKAILECSDMTNINIPSCFTKEVLETYENNFYVYGLAEYIEDRKKTVKVISKMTNNEYDDMLSKNIVFLNLIDASAVNTVIECVVRNTVLIVNRHPAIEEVLGVDYPGFYSNLKQVETLICSKENIVNIHKYLYDMDKSIFQIENFLDTFQNILSTFSC